MFFLQEAANPSAREGQEAAQEPWHHTGHQADQIRNDHRQQSRKSFSHCPSLCLSAPLSVSLSVCPSLRLSVCLPLSLSGKLALSRFQSMVLHGKSKNVGKSEYKCLSTRA